MPSVSSAIGVFDSGVGGVSVLRQLMRILPHEDFLYFGDNANAPYGTKSREEVVELSLRAAEQLFSAGVKALVVACNTATSVAIAAIRQRWPDKIVIGIEPALMLAAREFPGGRLGVMATPLTLSQEKYQNLRSHVDLPVASIPAKGLVELVEAGKAETEELRRFLQPLLAPYRGKLDALVLGCTHYPFAAKIIGELLGPETTLLDGGEGTARETLRRLKELGLTKESGEGKITFRFSGEEEKSISLARELLSANLPEWL